MHKTNHLVWRKAEWIVLKGTTVAYISISITCRIQNALGNTRQSHKFLRGCLGISCSQGWASVSVEASRPISWSSVTISSSEVICIYSPESSSWSGVWVRSMNANPKATLAATSSHTRAAKQGQNARQGTDPNSPRNPQLNSKERRDKVVDHTTHSRHGEVYAKSKGQLFSGEPSRRHSRLSNKQGLSANTKAKEGVVCSRGSSQSHRRIDSIQSFYKKLCLEGGARKDT